MKMCDKHWQELRAAIELRGLSHLVAGTGLEAAENLKKEFQGEETTYDPLMAATMGIYAAALENGGLYLMHLKEDGTEYCPLCEFESHSDEKAEAWINPCTDAIRKSCVAQGLVSQTQ